MNWIYFAIGFVSFPIIAAAIIVVIAILIPIDELDQHD